MSANALHDDVIDFTGINGINVEGWTKSLFFIKFSCP